MNHFLSNPNIRHPPRICGDEVIIVVPVYRILGKYTSCEPHVACPGPYLSIAVRETFLDKLARLFHVIVIHLYSSSARDVLVNVLQYRLELGKPFVHLLLEPRSIVESPGL